MTEDYEKRVTIRRKERRKGKENYPKTLTKILPTRQDNLILAYVRIYLYYPRKGLSMWGC
jgi:hypothetical protein